MFSNCHCDFTVHQESRVIRRVESKSGLREENGKDEKRDCDMGLNVEVATVLRDIVQFLECLRDVKLPVNLETDRDSLSTRSKDALKMFAMEGGVVGRPTSPEPYLNMNAARTKGLMATLKEEAELQEYVGAEEHQQIQTQQQQDYYETFQAVESSCNVATASSEAALVPDPRDNLPDKDEHIESALIDIYSCFSAAQTKNKCQISGFLYRKEGRKLFVFEQYRACWVGLVGFHLLVYGNDRDNRPCTIYPIRGYMARPAPNAIARDHRKSESTFEIVRPGSRTFQFIAKTPKDMEEWVRKICNLGSDGGVDKEHRDVIGRNENVKPINAGENMDRKEERYRQDVGSVDVDKPVDEHSVASIAVNCDTSLRVATEAENSFPNDAILPRENLDSPSLRLSPSSPVSADTVTASPPQHTPTLSLSQTHTPRRLPSLPARHSSYEFPDEEEDDIYHKIEDFRDAIHYGNILGTTQVKPDDGRSAKEFVTYDDVRSTVKPEKNTEGKRYIKDVDAVTIRSTDSRSEETYDDTANAVLLDTKGIDRQDSVSYDDVETFLSNSKSVKVRETRKPDESAKSPQKKSFLDRVRSKRESPRKVEKKTKLKNSPRASIPNVASSAGSPTYYDDVSDLINNVQQEASRFEEEQSEYTCPPPPRPIYVKPPVISDANEFYDDVTAYRNKFTNDDETIKLDQQATNKLDHPHNTTRLDVDSAVLCEKVDCPQQCAVQDNEHYKTPRVETRYRGGSINIDQGVEDLYDDIAILADFTARQKDILTRRESGSTMRSHANPEKKPWNRFVGGRKLKITDATTIGETNVRISNGMEDTADNFSEQHSSMRMNTFQKLISRMENSLGKGPARSTSSVILNKANAPNYL